MEEVDDSASHIIMDDKVDHEVNQINNMDLR
jgi:hypothetical protein